MGNSGIRPQLRLILVKKEWGRSFYWNRWEKWEKTTKIKHNSGWFWMKNINFALNCTHGWAFVFIEMGLRKCACNSDQIWLISVTGSEFLTEMSLRKCVLNSDLHSMKVGLRLHWNGSKKCLKRRSSTHKKIQLNTIVVARYAKTAPIMSKFQILSQNHQVADSLGKNAFGLYLLTFW